jgi:Carboxypeptidase regulatory-like domain
MRSKVASLLIAFTSSVLLPAAAHAQSSITGVVKDTTGAVLPGVTVEASSPALIEKARTSVTDAQGNYRIVDLRPGTYTLVFTLAGFQTVRREGLELPSNFTMTVNGDLKVGSLEETLTVTGASPVVDVQTAVKSQVLSREVLDSVPTGRTIQGLGQLVTGISLSTPDVGGTRAMQQTYMSAHGMISSQVTVQVDGMMVNGVDVDGAVQNYFNSSMSQEMVYQTSGAMADVSGGGIKLNMIPKDGGNRFHGSINSGYQPKQWQGDNLTDDLKARGLKAVGKIDKVYNVEAAQGGPIARDKLWFFVSARAFRVNVPIADAFIPPAGQNVFVCQQASVSCEQGIDDQSINSAQGRLTWQISPRHKFAIYADKINKNRGHAMSAGYDANEASIVWTSPLYMTGSAKLTSTLTSKLLFEAGYSTNYERYNTLYQSGLEKPIGSPEWYSVVNKQDSARGTEYGAGRTNQGMYPDRFNTQASMSYVTGSHAFKVGFQDTWGIYKQFRGANGDLRQFYQNGVPFQVQILNTPVRFEDDLNADIGIYGQDTWTFKRLTVNYGARWEYFSSQVAREVSDVGRFVTERSFGPIKMPTWKTFSPRSSVVYDLSGSGKTALKFGFSKYQQAGTMAFANAYNPLALTTANVSWTDLNGDDIAQGSLGCVYLTSGCEINVSGNATVAGQLPRNFGTATLSQVDPNIKRMYNVETNIQVQHELWPGVSVNAGWFHRDYYNLRLRDNIAVRPSDYTPQNIVSPLDGKVMTIYNVAAAKNNLVNTIDRTAPDRRAWYNGFEATFNARLARGGTLFGGYTTERMLEVLCDEPSNPNFLLYCDQRDSGIPWRGQFKLAGTYQLKYAVQLGVSFQSLPGYINAGAGTLPLYGFFGATSSNVSAAVPNGAGTVWLITPTTRYAANCIGPCTPGAIVNPGMTVASMSVPLVPPATELSDRVNQLDINVGKWFKVSNLQVQPRLDIFNTLNRSDVVVVRSLNYGTSSYFQPATVIQGRIVQVGLNMRW